MTTILLAPLAPSAPPAERHTPPHGDAGLGALIGTLLVAAIVLASLLWLVKPWRRSILPRARASWTRPDDDSHE